MSHTNDNIMFHRFGWYTRLIIRQREKERAKTKREGYFKWMKLRMFLENTFLAIMSNEETKMIKIMMMMIFECLFGRLFLFFIGMFIDLRRQRRFTAFISSSKLISFQDQPRYLCSLWAVVHFTRSYVGALNLFYTDTFVFWFWCILWSDTSC